MMFAPSKVSKTLIRYISTYVLVFLIPLSFYYIMFNTHFMKIFKEEVYLNNREATLKVRDSIDFQLKQMQNLIYQISLSDDFDSSYNTDPLNQISNVKRLRSYNEVNDFIFDIIYYQKNLDMAISSRGLMDLAVFSDYYFKYTQWPLNEMLDTLYNTKTPQWRSFEDFSRENNQVKVMTYIYPLTLLNGFDSNALMIQLEHSAFIKALALPDTTKSILFIMDRKGHNVFSTDSDTANYSSILQSLPVLKTGSSLTKQYNDLFITKAQSGFNDWTYISILPLHDVLGKANELQRIYTLFSILIFIVGLAIASYFSYINYSPIKGLLQVVEGLFKNPQEKPGSEINTATMAIRYLSETSRTLEGKIKSSTGLVQASMLRNLLQGKYDTVEDFNRLGEDFELSFKRNCFFVFILAITQKDAESTPLIQGTVNHAVEELLTKDFDIYGIDNIENNHFIFICAIDSEDESKVRKALKEVSFKMKGQNVTGIQIGASSFTYDVHMLYRKYIEAINVIEHLPSQSDADIAIYGSSKYQMTTNYPGEEIEEIKNALSSLDSDRFKLLTSQLLNYISGSKLSMFMKVCACYDMINTIIKAVQQIDRSAMADLNKYNMVLSDRNSSLDKLSGMLETLCSDVTNYLMGKVQNEEKTLIEKLKVYIEEHHLDYDFSVQKVAEQYEMSLSGLSHYFKNKTGQLISDYISDVKMSLSKDLLKNSQMSLKQIMERTGYTSMSSFIRKFKSHTGVTPGEYKDVHGK